MAGLMMTHALERMNQPQSKWPGPIITDAVVVVLRLGDDVGPLGDFEICTVMALLLNVRQCLNFND